MKPRHQPSSGSDGSTILLIEDSPENLDVAFRCLSSHGYQVLVAQDGEEGIQRAEATNPDLILLDVKMPGHDGIEVCRRLKEGAATRDIPVIFMTAMSEPADKLAGFDAGGSDYVTKPLQLEEFISRVQVHLRFATLQKEIASRNALLQQYGANLEQLVAKQTAELVESSHRLKVEIAERKQEFHSLVELSPDTIARYDKNCLRTYANPTLIAATGGDADAILGVTPSICPGGDSGRAYERILREVIESGERRDFELCWTSPAGQACTHIRMSPEFDLQGNVVQVLAVGRDITEIDRYRKEIYQQAFYDALTGLPNRLLFSERMQRAINEVSPEPFSMMTLDLDRFKEINDTRGHGVGDRILCETARRLEALAALHPDGFVARLGGDEFALLIFEPSGQTCPETVACHIKEILQPPFMIDGSEFVMTASIGIARFPDDADAIDGLFKYADLAMHHAKELGRDTFQFYTPDLTRRIAQRLELEGDLRKAQQRGELELYFQPQIEIRTERIVGAEALLRWRRPGHGLVGPDRFIPIAESTGLIVGIGEWVLTAACRAAATWNQGRTVPFRVAVNLSSRQFVRNDLAASIARILEETGCDPEWLKLEITESLLLEDETPVTSALQMLNRMGLSIAIDDFGTGYSALAYLNRFPVTELKIDRSFINGIPAVQEKCELVKAMLSFSNALHMVTVAEGVETPGQAEFLKSMGCRYAQGYLYGAPMAQPQFELMMQRSDELAFMPLQSSIREAMNGAAHARSAQ